VEPNTISTPLQRRLHYPLSHVTLARRYGGTALLIPIPIEHSIHRAGARGILLRHRCVNHAGMSNELLLATGRHPSRGVTRTPVVS